jgi:hypothetical protein
MTLGHVRNWPAGWLPLSRSPGLGPRRSRQRVPGWRGRWVLPTRRISGADSLFVPGLIDLDALAKLTTGPLPVAAMVWAGAPAVAEFAAVGVARISLGSAIAQAAYALAARATTEFLSHGTYDTTADEFLTTLQIRRSAGRQAPTIAAMTLSRRSLRPSWRCKARIFGRSDSPSWGSMDGLGPGYASKGRI